MVRRIKSLSGIVVGFMLLALTASTLAREPDRTSVIDATSQPVVTKVSTPAQQKATLALWTHAAIAAARPLALPTQTGAAQIDTTAQSEAMVSGTPGLAAAGAAAPGADQAAQAAYPRDWAVLKESLEQPTLATSDSLSDSYGTSQIYTSYTVNQASVLQTLYPHKWIGRLSFTTPGGTSYCSATSISGNLMLTAAHCLYDTTNNRWYSNWAFTPAYRNGSAPYGTFPWSQCWVLNQWVNLTGSFAINTWTRYDVAVCRMATNSSGTTLNNAVGFMGRQWNWPYIRHFHNLGYPFKDYNNTFLANAGLFLRTCVAESFLQTTDTRGMGCNYGGGISGGPWVTGYAPNVVSGYADGVNSGLFIGTQNLYAIRFTDANIVVLCNAAHC